MTAAEPWLNAIERSWGYDDWECPDHGAVRFSEPCDTCGRREGDGADDPDAQWDRWREERLDAGLPLWDGEDET